jgi:hypothetical protein
MDREMGQMPTVDNLADSHHQIRGAHWVDTGPSTREEQRINVLRKTVGDAQVNEWIVQIAEKNFDSKQAARVIQVASSHAGKPMKEEEISRIINVLQRWYMNHMDLYNNNTKAIIDRHEKLALLAQARRKKAPPSDVPAKSPTESPTLLPESRQVLEHDEGVSLRGLAAAWSHQRNRLDEHCKPLLALLNADQTLSNEHRAIIQAWFRNIRSNQDVMELWYLIRPR